MRHAVLAVVPLLLWTNLVPAHADEEPVDLALVVRVEIEPPLTPDGAPRPGVQPELREVARVLEELTALAAGEPPVPMSLAVSPVLVEELGVFHVPDAARTYTALLDLASRVPVLATPYANVKIPHLPSDDAVREQFAEGDRALADALEVDPRPVVYPPALALSEKALGALPHDVALAAADELDAQPALMAGVRLLPATHLPAGDDVVAVLTARYPAARDLVLTLEPDTATPGIVRSLVDDDRVRIVDLAELQARQVTERDVAFEPVTEPPDTYRTTLERAVNAVADFASYTSPDNSAFASMRTMLARAASSSIWEEDWAAGRAWADAVLARFRAEHGLVLAEDGSVTFTAQNGRIPVTVINLATYPVRLRVTVSSPKLDFPDGASREVEVPPRGDTITFLAEARSSGTFPVTVHVASPDGRVRFGAGEVRVRSAAANLSALVLTAGAALFLAGWFGHRIIGRRSGRA